MLYDANLVFSEEYSIAGVALGLVGDVKDTEVVHDIASGSRLMLEIECLEQPVGTDDYFSFLVIASNSADLVTSDPVTIAQSPIYGFLGHLSGTLPSAGSRSYVSLAGGFYGGAANELQFVNNTVYGRRYLGVYYVNHAYTLTAGASGTMTAGKFALRLTLDAPSAGRIYPGRLS